MNAPLHTAAMFCLVLNLQMAHGQSLPAEISLSKGLTPTELKDFYLECDAAAATARLPASDAMQCSIVAEELTQRVFGGDFGKLLTWWRVHRRDPQGYASGRR